MIYRKTSTVQVRSRTNNTSKSLYNNKTVIYNSLCKNLKHFLTKENK